MLSNIHRKAVRLLAGAVVASSVMLLVGCASTPSQIDQQQPAPVAAPAPPLKAQAEYAERVANSTRVVAPPLKAQAEYAERVANSTRVVAPPLKAQAEYAERVANSTRVVAPPLKAQAEYAERVANSTRVVAPPLKAQAEYAERVANSTRVVAPPLKAQAEYAERLAARDASIGATQAVTSSRTSWLLVGFAALALLALVGLGFALVQQLGGRTPPARASTS